MGFFALRLSLLQFVHKLTKRRNWEHSSNTDRTLIRIGFRLLGCATAALG